MVRVQIHGGAGRSAVLTKAFFSHVLDIVTTSGIKSKLLLLLHLSSPTYLSSEPEHLGQEIEKWQKSQLSIHLCHPDCPNLSASVKCAGSKRALKNQNYLCLVQIVSVQNVVMEELQSVRISASASLLKTRLWKWKQQCQGSKCCQEA